MYVVYTSSYGIYKRDHNAINGGAVIKLMKWLVTCFGLKLLSNAYRKVTKYKTTESGKTYINVNNFRQASEIREQPSCQNFDPWKQKCLFFK